MDQIEFILQEKQNDSCHYTYVTILVNEQDIIDKLKKHEMPFAKKEGLINIAGSYEGLLPETLYNN